MSQPEPRIGGFALDEIINATGTGIYAVRFAAQGREWKMQAALNPAQARSLAEQLLAAQAAGKISDLGFGEETFPEYAHVLNYIEGLIR